MIASFWAIVTRASAWSLIDAIIGVLQQIAQRPLVIPLRMSEAMEFLA
jgi:hypothetical protein